MICVTFIEYNFVHGKENMMQYNFTLATDNAHHLLTLIIFILKRALANYQNITISLGNKSKTNSLWQLEQISTRRPWTPCHDRTLAAFIVAWHNYWDPQNLDGII
ncbi:hypothetical protein ACJX0J_024979, partial [Zea mays]